MGNWQTVSAVLPSPDALVSALVCFVRGEIILIRWWELNAVSPGAGKLWISGEQPDPQWEMEISGGKARG